jgi:hypothetical protein
LTGSGNGGILPCAYGAVQFHETALFNYRKVFFMVTRFSDVHTPWLDTADTPQIKLQGAYLERMGFHVGMNIKIEVEKGRIVITPMEDIEEGEAV